MNLQKPKFGSPCNGCGLCCQTSFCVAAEIMFPTLEAPCPALVLEDGRYRCGIVIMEKVLKVEPLTANVLGIGCGCSMEDEDTTRAEAEAFNALAKRMVAGKLPRQTPI